MKCKNCVFANKAGNKDSVFCTYWQSQLNDSGMSEETFVIENMYRKYDYPKEVALGWGYPHQHIKAETHWSKKGTATEGMMWNNQIIIDKEDHCFNFREYKNPNDSFISH